MKKIFTFILFILLTIFLFSSNIEVNAKYVENGKILGINIDSNYVPFRMPNNNFRTSEKKNISKDLLQNYTRVDEILLQNKIDNSLYIFAYRIAMSPKDGRNWGVMGIGSYGGQYQNLSAKTTCQLDTNCNLLNYEPKNKENTSSGSIGINLDSSGFSVSASVDYNHSELSIISNSSLGSNLYDVEYKFYRRFTYPFMSDYVKGDVFLYGMFAFQTTESVNITVHHEISYMDISPATGGNIDNIVFSHNY